ncbi:hypothetical protein [Paenisporosarcina indica]|nr:hypothetical protein [Paenisporosarcina indica]
MWSKLDEQVETGFERVESADEQVEGSRERGEIKMNGNKTNSQVSLTVA